MLMGHLTPLASGMIRSDELTPLSRLSSGPWL